MPLLAICVCPHWTAGYSIGTFHKYARGKTSIARAFDVRELRHNSEKVLRAVENTPGRAPIFAATVCGTFRGCALIDRADLSANAREGLIKALSNMLTLA